MAVKNQSKKTTSKKKAVSKKSSKKAPKKAPKKKPQKKNKNNAGRKTKMTKDVVMKLEHAFLMGCSDTEACLFADISRTALHNYQKKHPEYVDRKQELKQFPVFLARMEVLKGIQVDPVLAFKFLERKRRKEFGPDNNFSLSADVEVNSTSMSVTTEMSEDEAANVYRDFIKKGKK